MVAKTKPKKEVIFATGKRKNAIVRVQIMPGKGNVLINGKTMANYCQRKMLELKIMEPFEVTRTTGQFDVIANASGGGIAGQAGAIRHSIARALCKYDINFRLELKKAKLLTRDSRIKERKKYGRKRARRGFQWTKR